MKRWKSDTQHDKQTLPGMLIDLPGPRVETHWLSDFPYPSSLSVADVIHAFFISNGFFQVRLRCCLKFLKKRPHFLLTCCLFSSQNNRKIAMFGQLSRFSAWECCLASAKFLTNFSLVLLIKVLLIKKSVYSLL